MAAKPTYCEVCGKRCRGKRCFEHRYTDEDHVLKDGYWYTDRGVKKWKKT